MENKIVLIIDEYVTNNILSKDDYILIKQYIGWAMWNYHMKSSSLSSIWVTNQFLIDIKESNYDTTLSEWQKKNLKT